MQQSEKNSGALSLNPEVSLFFREVLESAFTAKRFNASEASGAYLLDLLVEYAGKPPEGESSSQPFALRLAHAMDAEPVHRFERLRTLGDDVLFLSGFFQRHLQRRGVNREYAAGLGQIAYGGAASVMRRYSGERPPVFAELSERFSDFAELLEHVADSVFANSARSGSSILELYERYQRTGSQVLARALARLGVTALSGRVGDC